MGKNDRDIRRRCSSCIGDVERLCQRDSVRGYEKRYFGNSETFCGTWSHRGWNQYGTQSCFGERSSGNSLQTFPVCNNGSQFEECYEFILFHQWGTGCGIEKDAHRNTEKCAWFPWICCLRLSLPGPSGRPIFSSRHI